MDSTRVLVMPHARVDPDLELFKFPSLAMGFAISTRLMTTTTASGPSDVGGCWAECAPAPGPPWGLIFEAMANRMCSIRAFGKFRCYCRPFGKFRGFCRAF